jgi:uncharacterized protein (TIGR02391 family)
VDVERAIGVLERWINTAEPLRQLFQPAYEAPYLESHISKDHPQIGNLREWEDQTARVIQRALDLAQPPSLLIPERREQVDIQFGIDLARRALGVLRTDEGTRAILGSAAPTMSADSLHPVVWGAASKRWESGHYIDAVQRAATAFSGLVKDRTGRYELGDSDLMTQAFSLTPAQEGKPRLRWPGKDDDLTVKAMRQGILNLAQGTIAAIRNPASHTTDNLPRQEALEQLAILSLLARWVERCELEST